MLIAHHLNNSRSQRILWLLEELGLGYEIVDHKRDPVTMRAPASVRTVHPLGKLPVLIDGDLVLAESGAIVDYVLSRYGEGRLMPAEAAPEWVRYRYWMHAAEGSFMPHLVMKLVFDQIETGRVPFLLRPVLKGLARAIKAKIVEPEITRCLDYMEAELARGPWFAGPVFTAADIQMSFVVQGAAARAGLDRTRPRLLEWLDRIEARPAWKRSVERGGPFAL